MSVFQALADLMAAKRVERELRAEYSLRSEALRLLNDELNDSRTAVRRAEAELQSAMDAEIEPRVTADDCASADTGD